MATLKSIKNKYLDASDGEVLGVDQNKDNVSLLAFKLAAADSIAKFDMRDGVFDDFQDTSGVDASASTNETRDSSGKYFTGVVLGNYTIDAFTSTGSDTWTCPANTTSAEVLTVAGGGGGASGGRVYSGGGGGGGVVHGTAYPVTPGTVYDLTVGAGGAQNTNGSDSVFNVNGEGTNTTVLTAKGGGDGGNPISGNGNTGGSGGGGAAPSGTGGSTNQTTSFGSPQVATGYGEDAQDGGGNPGTSARGGGGGGAGAAATNWNGGAGKYFENFSGYGDSGYFGGGGATQKETDANGDFAAGVGGAGGGADGRARPGSAWGDGAAGTANTGGGGAGAAGHDSQSRNGGAGGSGVVLIRSRPEAYNDMTLISNATTAQAQPDTVDLVLKYTNGAGTATINTDMKAYVSRDDGTTYTETTLVSEGTTGSDTILAARRVDISGQPAGTSMRYKVTTHNQSASKETRLQAASLAWA